MRLLLLVVAWHYQLVYLLAERSPQERDDLGAGTVVARCKGCLVHARGHAVHVAPRHRFIRPFGHIGERQVEHPRAREALALRLSIAVDHGRSLCTGADAVCAEGCLRQAGDDAAARRPADCLGIICALVHIGKRHQVIHHGGTRRAPEEGHNLRAGAWLVRSKQAVADAAGDAVLRRPLDGLVVIGIVRHVIEEVENAVVLHKGRLDLDLARGHGEGVLAAALVGELQIIAVLVGDGYGFQHIAAVRLYRNRYGAARRGVLRADSHRAVVCLIRNADRIAGGTATPASTIVAPVCRIGSVASAARVDGDGHIVLAVKPRAAPAGEGIAGFGGILEGESPRLDGVGVGIALRSAAGQIIGNRVLVDLPLRPILLVARFGVADCRHRIAGQAFVIIPALEGVPGARHICRECCTHAVGVFGDIAVVDRAAVCVQGYGIGRGCPLHRQGRHISRNTAAGFVGIAIAVKPHKVTACISIGAVQTVGRRRGKLAAVFHDDLNSIGATAQLAAVQVKGNDLQSARAQCVRVQDFKDGAETT